jgi:hypothetical protein
LRTALWQYAATHKGNFPSPGDITAIASDLWEIPESSGLRFLYREGKTAGFAPEILVFEPEWATGQRLILRTNGDILMQTTSEIRNTLKKEGQP